MYKEREVGQLLQVQDRHQLLAQPAHAPASPISDARAAEAAQEAIQQLSQQDGQICMDPGQAAAALHSYMASMHSASTAAGAQVGMFILDAVGGLASLCQIAAVRCNAAGIQ